MHTNPSLVAELARVRVGSLEAARTGAARVADRAEIRRRLLLRPRP